MIICWKTSKQERTLLVIVFIYVKYQIDLRNTSKLMQTIEEKIMGVAPFCVNNWSTQDFWNLLSA